MVFFFMSLKPKKKFLGLFTASNDVQETRYEVPDTECRQMITWFFDADYNAIVAAMTR